MDGSGSTYIPREIVRDFEVRQQLGETAAGRTYLLERREDQRLCILRYDRSPLKSPRERRCLEESYVRLRRFRYPAFPEVVQFGIPRSGGHYLISRFIHGVSLANLPDRAVPELIAEVLGQILPALHLLHRSGIVHQRLSAERIIISDPSGERHVSIADVGLSRQSDGRRPASPGYSAPEVGHESRIDGRADLYSLAVIAYELVRGAKPFAPRHVSDLSESGPICDVPPMFGEESERVAEFESLLLRMGSHDQSFRPENALVAMRELIRTGLLTGQPPSLDAKAYVENTIWQVLEKKVKPILEALAGTDRRVEVTHDDGLEEIAGELRLHRELRKAPRFVTIHPGADRGRTSPRKEETEPPPLRLHLEAAEAGEIVETADGLRAKVTPGIDEAALNRWLVSFCMGPIDRRRSKLLSTWLIYRHDANLGPIAAYLEKHLYWDEGIPRLKWEEIGAQIADETCKTELNLPKNHFAKFPKRHPIENANYVARHCFPREAGYALKAIADNLPDSIKKARILILAAILTQKSGLVNVTVEMLERAACILEHEGSILSVVVTERKNFQGTVQKASEFRASPRNRGLGLVAGPSKYIHRAFRYRTTRRIIRQQQEGQVQRAMTNIGRLRTLERSIRSKGTNVRLLHPLGAPEKIDLARLYLKQRTLFGEMSRVAKIARRVLAGNRHRWSCAVAAGLQNVFAHSFLSTGAIREATTACVRSAKNSLCGGDLQRAATAMEIQAVICFKRHDVRRAHRWIKAIGTSYGRFESQSLGFGLASTRLGIEYAMGRYRYAAAIGLRSMRAQLTVPGIRRLLRLKLNCALSFIGMGRLSGASNMLCDVVENASKAQASELGVKAALALLYCRSVKESFEEADSRASWESELGATVSSEDAENSACWMLRSSLWRKFGRLKEPKSSISVAVDKILVQLGRDSEGLRRGRADWGARGDESKPPSDEWTRLLWLEEQVLWRRIEELPNLIDLATEALARSMDSPDALLGSRLAVAMTARLLAMGWVDETERALSVQRRMVRHLDLSNAAWGDTESIQQFTLAKQDLANRVEYQRQASNLVQAEALISDLTDVSTQAAYPVCSGSEVDQISEELIQDLMRPWVGGVALAVLHPGVRYALFAAAARSGARAVLRKLPLEDAFFMRELAGWRKGIVISGRTADGSFIICSTGSSLQSLVVGRFLSDGVVLCGERVSLCAKFKALAESRFAIETRASSNVRLGRDTVTVAFRGRHRDEQVQASSDNLHGELVVRSMRMIDIVDRIAKLSRAGVPLVLQGETGTGKEELAKLAHSVSGRAGAPFVAVDCPGLVSNLAESELFGHVKGAFTGAECDRLGLVEEVGTGTLFLDEVGDLSGAIQAKLLRVLSSRDFRKVGSNTSRVARFGVVSATNLDLHLEAQMGRFRDDLLHRLGVRIEVPPLRERRDEIAPLWDNFMLGAKRPGLEVVYDSDVLDLVQSADWPGNVRELKNVAIAAAAMSEGGRITASTVLELLSGAGASDLRGVKGLAANDRSLTERLHRGLRFVESAGRVSRRVYARELGVAARTALRDLNWMVSAGIVTRAGKGRAATYVFQTQSEPGP